MKKLLLTIVAGLALVGAGLASAPTASAYSCAQFAKMIEYNYNSAPGGFNSNYLQWTVKSGASPSQVFLVERSNDSGGSWSTVQSSTIKKYQTADYLDDNVRLRVSTIGCGGAPAVFNHDPVAGPLLRTTYF